jgi:hypothetical protein
MQRALDTLVQGSNGELAVELETGARPRRVAHPDTWWAATNPASASDELVSDAAAVAFVGTDRALDELLAEGATSALAQIKALRPDLDFPDAPDVITTDWRNEEWSLGSYPNWGLGWDWAMNDAFADRTVGRVALAGADTSGAFIGGMEGALKTARIAVMQLLKKLRDG